jgi:type II secretory pathway pseudopilin PulG
MTWEATMTGVAVLAVISILGIVSAVIGIAYVSLGIRRDDRRSVVGAPAALSRASRIARHATGAHGLSAPL